MTTPSLNSGMNPNLTQVQASEIPAAPPQLEEDLSQLLDEQVARLVKKRRQANWVIFAFFGLMMGSASAWYASSEGNRRMVADLIMDIKASGKDFKLIGSATGMASQYDKALEKIGTRSQDVDQATTSLGIDPTKVTEDGMETEMKDMMGGKGKTSGERNRLLQQKLGGFAKAQVKEEQKNLPEKAPVSKVKTPPTRPIPAQVVVPAADDEPIVIP